MSAAIVLLAAGSGTRVGATTNKVLLPLTGGDQPGEAGDTCLGRCLRTVLTLPDVSRIVLVARAGDEATVAAIAEALLGDREAAMVLGGSTRHDSEQAALGVLRPAIDSGEVDVVAIHDAARPLATAALFATTLAEARQRGGAVPVAPLGRLLTRSLEPAEPGRRLVGVQTPQSFRAAPLLAAYDAAARDGAAGTDTAATLERYAAHLEIAAVPSTALNVKVTFADDLAAVARLSPPA
ncbi:MAG: 2-C-methyl-D-erythritol 4-phosphate cytidylyltransferase [Nocardioides sp.]|uniref:IspD/TarI family cytidylyltransferase n=1 Tax=Nocardioides sp. TaxID=35761 RepID=UPI0039E6AC3A